MRTSSFLAAAFFSRASCQDLESLSPEDNAKALKNWNATMTAHGLKGSSRGSCNKDFRSTLPACMQYQPEWCRATAVAELSHFYQPSKYPETGADCHGVECAVVAHKSGKNCCTVGCAGSNSPICCKNWIGVSDCETECGFFSHNVTDLTCNNQKACGQIAGQPADIVEGITHFAGQRYVSKMDGPLTQDELDTVLSKGYPVVIGVFWTMGGGHALTLGGCSGGKYYLHDPLNKEGNYQMLSYEDVATYNPPEKTSLFGKWKATWYREGSLDASSTHEVIV